MKIIIDAKNESVSRPLEAFGLTSKRHAKAKCPVDTGGQRNSITRAAAKYEGQGVYEASIIGSEKN